MLKIRCSGSFRTSPGTDENRHDFTHVEGVMPDCEEEFILPHAMRLFPIWKKEDKNLKDIAFSGLIKVYIDDVEEVEGVPACVGKDIKTMTWEELQSMACLLKIREIPMYRQGSLRAAQEKAYEMYQSKIMGRRVFKTSKDISMFKDTLRRNLEAMMLNAPEIEKRIEEECAKAFNMIVNTSNPERSYSFSNVDSVIIEGYNSPKSSKDQKEQKKALK